jgi:hypothetical protein
LESSSFSSSTLLSENGSGGQSIKGIHGRGEDEQELWKRSEGEGDELRDFKGREPLFLLGILAFHNMNVDLSTGRMQREKTKSKRAQGQAGVAKKCGRAATLCPQKFWVFPKISL